MLTKAELFSEFRTKCLQECKRQSGRQTNPPGEDLLSVCGYSSHCTETKSYCESVYEAVIKEQDTWNELFKAAGVKDRVREFRNRIETAYLRNPTGCGGSFGEILCYEIHETGLTFKDLARLWNVDLELLGEVIKDHCIKLKTYQI